MRRNVALFGTLFLLAMASVASANIVISEVCDGTRSGGGPKWVELTNTGNAPVDLSTMSIGNMNNGSTTLGGGASTVLPAVVLNAKETFIVGYEFEPVAPAISIFEDLYGVAPGIFIGPFINGDDVIVLFDGPATGDGSDATILDVVGEIGVDGTGTAWEWTDSFGWRQPGENLGSAIWDDNRYYFAGPDALEAGSDAVADSLMLANTSPGTHVTTTKSENVPGAPAWVVMMMMVLLAGAGFMAFTRMKAVHTA